MAEPLPKPQHQQSAKRIRRKALEPQLHPGPPLAEVPDAGGSPGNGQSSLAILIENLRREECDLAGGEGAIRSWLTKRALKGKVVTRNFVHKMAQWIKGKGLPEIESIEELADITGLSLNSLLGHAPEAGSNAPPGGSERERVRQMLETWALFSCYSLYIPRNTLDTWKREAEELEKAEEARRLKAAARWASEAFLHAATPEFMAQFGLSANTLTEQTLFDMTKRRLERISQACSDPAQGERLVAAAKRQALDQVYRAIVREERHGTTPRFPALRGIRKGEKVRWVVQSVVMTVEELPQCGGDRGWLVHYTWLPRLSPRKVEALLAQQGDSARDD